VKVIITQHCKARMLARNITEVEIYDTISAPTRTWDTPQGSRCFERDFSGRTLKVWIKWPPKPKNLYIVKSAAWKGEEDGWQK